MFLIITSLLVRLTVEQSTVNLRLTVEQSTVNQAKYIVLCMYIPIMIMWNNFDITYRPSYAGRIQNTFSLLGCF